MANLPVFVIAVVRGSPPRNLLAPTILDGKRRRTAPRQGDMLFFSFLSPSFLPFLLFLSSLILSFLPVPFCRAAFRLDFIRSRGPTSSEQETARPSPAFLRTAGQARSTTRRLPRKTSPASNDGHPRWEKDRHLRPRPLPSSGGSWACLESSYPAAPGWPCGSGDQPAPRRLGGPCMEMEGLVWRKKKKKARCRLENLRVGAWVRQRRAISVSEVGTNKKTHKGVTGGAPRNGECMTPGKTNTVPTM